jgi:hypothetical protein
VNLNNRFYHRPATYATGKRLTAVRLIFQTACSYQILVSRQTQCQSNSATKMSHQDFQFEKFWMVETARLANMKAAIVAVAFTCGWQLTV